MKTFTFVYANKVISIYDNVRKLPEHIYDTILSKTLNRLSELKIPQEVWREVWSTRSNKYSNGWISSGGQPHPISLSAARDGQQTFFCLARPSTPKGLGDRQPRLVVPSYSAADPQTPCTKGQGDKRLYFRVPYRPISNIQLLRV